MAAASWVAPDAGVAAGVGAGVGVETAGAVTAAAGACPPTRARSNPVAEPDAGDGGALDSGFVGVVDARAGLLKGGTELNPGRGISVSPARNTGVPPGTGGDFAGASGAAVARCPSGVAAASCASRVSGWLAATGGGGICWLPVVVCAPLVLLAVVTRTGAGAGWGAGALAAEADWLAA